MSDPPRWLCRDALAAYISVRADAVARLQLPALGAICRLVDRVIGHR